VLYTVANPRGDPELGAYLAAALSVRRSTDIDPGEYASLRDLFEEAVATHGNKPAFVNMGATLTFAQLDALTLAFAAWLQKKSGSRRETGSP